MTSLDLLGIFLTLFAILRLRTLLKSKHWPELILMAICLALSVFAIIAEVIWSGIRSTLPYGLLGFLTNSEDQVRVFKGIILSIALGLFTASLTSFFIGKLKSGFAPETRSNVVAISSSDFADRPLAVLIGIHLVIVYTLGQGDSILDRGIYLESNGIIFFERYAAVISLPVILLVSYSLINSRRTSFRLTYGLILFSMLLLTLSRASRMCVIMTLCVGIFLLVRFQRWTVRIAISLSILTLVSVLYEMCLISRSQSHGLLNLDSVFLSTLSSDGRSLIDTLMTLLGSIFMIFVILPRGSSQGSFDLLLGNLNPLIGSGFDALSFSSLGAERLWPYRWVPLSTAAQIYEVGGFLALFSIGLVLSIFFLSSTSRIIHIKNGMIFFVMISAAYVAQFLFLLQYSTRVWSRMAQVFILLCLASFVLAKTSVARNSLTSHSISTVHTS